MSIDINGIKKGLIEITRTLIGYRLSTIPAGGGTTKPAVIKNRSGGNAPSFPYASIDEIGLRKVGRGSSSQYFDDNEDEVSQFDYVGRFSIQINGGNDQDTQSISSELSSRLLTTQGLSLVGEHLLDAKILKINSPTFLPSLMVTDYEEASIFTLDLSIRDCIVDTTTEIIENVDVNGLIYDDFKTDDTPLSVQTIAP
mgnify:CR=1 FL=1|tara:strand:+ start:1040 stop:1633 length:594 start_codon:yes stop_codon:yes gene_type:complete